jgi:hypothetical protein
MDHVEFEVAMPAAILTATTSIEGLRPLPWHHFGPDALRLEEQECAGPAGNDPAAQRKAQPYGWLDRLGRMRYTAE